MGRFRSELLRKEEEIKNGTSNATVEANYQLEKVLVQVRILEDYSAFDGAVLNIFKRTGPCAGGVSSKCDVKPKVKVYKAHIEKTTVKSGDNNVISSQLSP